MGKRTPWAGTDRRGRRLAKVVQSTTHTWGMLEGVGVTNANRELSECESMRESDDWV